MSQGAAEDRSLIGAVGEQFGREGIEAEQRCQQRYAAITVVNIRGGDEAGQEQPLGVDQNVPLLARDQLGRVPRVAPKARPRTGSAVRVNPRPPFSALFTLWLSMIQAVGLASRCAFSRHLT